MGEAIGTPKLITTPLSSPAPHFCSSYPVLYQKYSLNLNPYFLSFFLTTPPLYSLCVKPPPASSPFSLPSSLLSSFLSSLFLSSSSSLLPSSYFPSLFGGAGPNNAGAVWTCRFEHD